MDEYENYTIRNGLGIRIINARVCQVIRRHKGEWVNVGREYTLPVEESALVWTRAGIPATVLAVALRLYELDNPGSRLREILCGAPHVAYPRPPQPRASFLNAAR